MHDHIYPSTTYLFTMHLPLLLCLVLIFLNKNLGYLFFGFWDMCVSYSWLNHASDICNMFAETTSFSNARMKIS